MDKQIMLPYFHLVQIARAAEQISKSFLVNQRIIVKIKSENAWWMGRQVCFETKKKKKKCRSKNLCKNYESSHSGTLRLSESDGESTSTTPQISKAAKTTLDGLSSDYADMTLGNASSAKSANSMRNTGPTLSPKENIKKLKSSFFGCNKIDEHKMDCQNDSNSQVLKQQSTTPVPTTSKNPICDDSMNDYTIMNPVLPNTGRRIVAHQPPLQSMSTSQSAVPITTKKTALVTSNNNPDKVLANTQVKNSIDGFKPITSRADKEVYKQSSKSSATTSNTSFGRQHSAPVEKGRKPSSDNGGYELLELRSSSSAHAVNTNNRIARPNSVNSEKTSFTPLIRPNSANSERHSTSTFSLTSTPESGAASVS